ncbi:muconolactone delta-isomerase [Halopolyspora algeriensis]|uniref:Muconolactone Delta-isomerase n=1 Tax=Halopolyspora algeriensis TaxID=1500506 RepID=A0A368VX85_9ACTN|nr:muconolactone Delta-isomerase [Halopolyspora algeriensis]RCW45970.1 muconolactone delta-isomerase [Halopolyspora algeriensis]TQM55383.1 muconolactone delta-isomerase [Halopolyspora algeriensis]
MLFAVKMDVHLPPDMDSDVKADILAREKAYSQEVQTSGEWPHIWRCVGQYSNLSIFDVDSNQRLHDILSQLPLFPYMHIDVTPLATHPSDIALLERNP